MLINTWQGWGFVAVPKNASTTIEELLRPHSSIWIEGAPRLKHLPARQVHRFLLPLLDAMDTPRPHLFAVVRDPVAFLYSHFRFRQGDKFANTDHRFREFSAHGLSFAAFVEAAVSSDRPAFAKVQPQRQYVTLDDGCLGVDTLLRFEELNETLLPFLRGFPFMKLRADMLPRLNASRPPADEITPWCVETILSSERFGPDKELHDKAGWRRTDEVTAAHGADEPPSSQEAGRHA